jgi:hypothetical protein
MKRTRIIKYRLKIRKRVNCKIVKILWVMSRKSVGREVLLTSYGEVLTA